MKSDTTPAVIPLNSKTAVIRAITIQSILYSAVVNLEGLKNSSITGKPENVTSFQCRQMNWIM